MNAGAVPEPVPEPKGEQDRTLALVAHLGGPVGLLFSAGLLGFLIPLVVWLDRRRVSTFAADQAKEALNFQITLLLLHLAGWVFVVFTLGIGLLVWMPVYYVLWVGELALGIWAAMRVYSGELYRYPFNMRLL